MTQPITDEQLQAIDKLRNDFPFSVSLDHVDTLRQALRERDAAIAELRHRLDDARTVSDRWANECSKEVAEKHALQSQLAELRNSALSYQLQRDMANALVQKQEQMLAELRKPVAVERNEVVEQIRSELWLTIEISHYTVERLIDQYDSVAERLADRVRMLGFVQDQLTSRNKENEELKERERELRAILADILEWYDMAPDQECYRFIASACERARGALAQPQPLLRYDAGSGAVSVDLSTHLQSPHGQAQLQQVAALRSLAQPQGEQKQVRGKRCTCDTSNGGSIPCYVESGGKLGELWYCAKKGKESGNG
jgi:hypothetical protein